MNEKYLFIGGCADGEWHEVPRWQSVYNVAKRVPRPPAFRAEWEAEPCIPAESTSYRLESINTTDKLFRVYVDFRMTLDDAIAALVKGYKPAPADYSNEVPNPFGIKIRTSKAVPPGEVWIVNEFAMSDILDKIQSSFVPFFSGKLARKKSGK